MQKQVEPLWPSLLALIAVGGLNMALPDQLCIGPRWLLLALVALIMGPVEILHTRNIHKFCRPLGFVVISIVTVGMIYSLIRLVTAIPSRLQTPEDLLRSAIYLWFTNIFVFSVWYWRLDAGGPHKRGAREIHSQDDAAFLFPQMAGEVGTWTPQFIDYLFLAFNTSTALSPTDAPILSRWAKALMMVQATISLTVIVFLVARAINIL
jgi:uncharacterized membrane protein